MAHDYPGATGEPKSGDWETGRLMTMLLSIVESVTHYIADICGVLLIVGGTR